jgi:hypothetical protein
LASEYPTEICRRIRAADITIEFLIGFISGAAVLTFIAVRMAAKPSPAHSVSDSSISAVGLDMNNKAVTIDSYNAKLLRDVMRYYEGSA